MTTDNYEFLLGQIIAQGLILRGLWTKWAIEAPDPRGSNQRMIEGLITSMHQVDPPKSDDQQRLWKVIETTLREFGEQVEIRLKGEGYQS